jgi:hypothetical protein
MGKIIDRYKKTIICALLLLLFSIIRVEFAFAFTESELFEKAYNNYLSYKPDKALELFDLFLNEYPESSARDAVLYWKAKSLIQLGRADEAKNIFMRIREEYSDGFFKEFAEKEVAYAGNTETESFQRATGTPDEISGSDGKGYAETLEKLRKENESLRKKLTKFTRDNRPLEKELKGDVRVVDRYILTDDSRALMAELNKLNETKEKVEAETRRSISQLEAEMTKLQEERKALLNKVEELESAGRSAEQLTANPEELEKMYKEKERLSSSHEMLLKEKSIIEDEFREFSNRMEQYVKPVIRIEEDRYSMRNIIDYHLISSEVLSKVKIGPKVWRMGDMVEVFIIERILFNKARRNSVRADGKILKTLVKKYKLNKKEKEHLSIILSVDRYVSAVLSERFIGENEIKQYYESHKKGYLVSGGEKIVKALFLDYTLQDELEKALLATDFQRKAVNGESFEQISGSYPDISKVEEMKYVRLPEWVKEKSAGLKSGEISDVISLKNRYVIFEIQMKKAIYRKLDDVKSEIREKISFQKDNYEKIASWLSEIKGEAEVIK